MSLWWTGELYTVGYVYKPSTSQLVEGDWSVGGKWAKPFLLSINIGTEMVDAFPSNLFVKLNKLFFLTVVFYSNEIRYGAIVLKIILETYLNWSDKPFPSF